MKSPLISSLKVLLLPAAASMLLVFGLTACGGGSSSSTGRDEPAPQTFNGLSLTIYDGGPRFQFIRSDGDAVNGEEFGAVTMDPDPAQTTLINSEGQAFALIPSSSVTGGRYRYTRTSAETGRIIITGASTNNGNYLRSGFERQFVILFASQGGVINAIDVSDSGEDIFALWTNPRLLTIDNRPVPVGYNLDASNLINIPALYPDSISRQTFQVFPDDASDPGFNFRLLQSDFTRFLSGRIEFERGVGNRNVIGDPDTTLINYEYTPDLSTNNRVVIRTVADTESHQTYNMLFLDKKSGTYFRENGTTGRFEFPFLDVAGL